MAARALAAQQSDASAASGIVSPSRLAHVVLRTSRYQAMLDWYRLVLHAETAFDNGHIGFLSYDEEHHRVAFINVPGLSEQPEGICGLHHVAFTFDTLLQLLDNYARLKELGVAPAWAVNHGPTTSLYYADPDGNQIEFQVDNYDTVEEAGEFFFSDAFDVNPIGVDFDPEDLRRRLLAGEDEAILKRRPPSGPVGIEGIKLR
jgi:catechol 2,3-dioxygenase-like lactoylglutathione lyase family enzyme